jgi:hypothetical protein
MTFSTMNDCLLFFLFVSEEVESRTGISHQAGDDGDGEGEAEAEEEIDVVGNRRSGEEDVSYGLVPASWL